MLNAYDIDFLFDPTLDFSTTFTYDLSAVFLRIAKPFEAFTEQLYLSWNCITHKLILFTN